MGSNLEKRFLKFVSQLPGFLPADGQGGVAMLRYVKGLQICDHFSNHPELSVSLSLYERKRLTENKSFTNQELAFARRLNRHIAAAGGQINLALSTFDPALVDKLKDRLDDVVCKANGQIRDTGLRMYLPQQSYNGLLIVNEMVEIFGHDVLMLLCQAALAKRNSDGGIRYSHINGIVIVDETQRLVGSSQGAVVYQSSVLCQRDDADRIGYELARLWSQFAPANQFAGNEPTSFLRSEWSAEHYLTSFVRSVSRGVGPEGLFLKPFAKS